ncbi:DUF305 domain-containing protein [Planobispora longispora]|nr:DUF305 domain-containing protein [Planobispora longispora]
MPLSRMSRGCLALGIAAASVLAASACGADAASHHHAGPAPDGAAPAPGVTTPVAGGTAPATDDGTEADAATRPAESDTPAGVFNAADVMFLQMMIPHHRQGAELAALAKARSAREPVRTLAAAIAATQGDEARTMTDWLRAWRQPLEAEPHAHDAHGGLHVTPAEEAEALAGLRGAAFDARFLNVLIAHQHNAVEMARTELKTGRNPQAVELARRIERSRSEQIRQMLAELSS